MADAKLRIKLGDLEFEGEGDPEWLTERLDALIEKAPSLLRAPQAAPQKTDAGGSEKQAPMDPDPTIAGTPLGTLLKEKKVGENQTKKFLATAVWLESKGKNRLKTGDVTKALSSNNVGLALCISHKRRDVATAYRRCSCSRLQREQYEAPLFHLTELGRSILESEAPKPFDPEGYIDFVRRKVPKADPTVLAYLAESLNTQRHNSLVASAVMLGIAAERVFLLVCESLHGALKDPKQKKQFVDILDRFPMKPKVDWVRNNIDELQKAKLEGVPDNAGLMIVAIYDLMRHQRNELGHPREQPPALTRDDVLGAIQIFIRYYETADALRVFLKNPV